MAWEDSPTYSPPRRDMLSTHKYPRISRPDMLRTGDANHYNISSKYCGEVEFKEPSVEELGQFAADDSIPMAARAARFSRSRLATMKSEDPGPAFMESPLRTRADYQSHDQIQADRKGHWRPSKELLHSGKSWEGQLPAKFMPLVKTSVDADRQAEILSAKGTNLVGCKAGMSSLLFSSVFSTFTKSNNVGQKRNIFSNLGCTAAPDVCLPTSATKVVRASADWDVKKVKHKSSKASRGCGDGPFMNPAGRNSQRRVGVASHTMCHQSSAQAIRRQTTPIVDPDIWCSRGLSLTTDATSLDCFVPSGNVHVCRRNRVSSSSQNVGRVAGTQSERSSREHPGSTRRAENPEKLSDLVLVSGCERRHPVTEVAPTVRNHQLQGSRHSTGGLAEILSALEQSERHDDLSYKQLLMLEATLLLGGMDVYDQHRDWRLDVDNMSYEELLELGDRIGYVNTGLSEESIIRCLKKMKHCILEAASARFATENERKCSICQEEYEANDELGKLECNHIYHLCCIKQWLLQKNACPVCKASAFS